MNKSVFRKSGLDWVNQNKINSCHKYAIMVEVKVQH